jgi:hypothetical protein
MKALREEEKRMKICLYSDGNRPDIYLSNEYFIKNKRIIQVMVHMVSHSLGRLPPPHAKPPKVKAHQPMFTAGTMCWQQEHKWV